MVLRRTIGAAVLAVVLAVTATLMVHERTASAGGAYSSGATGYDVSQNQCGQSAPGSFGIVAVTSGRAFYHNSCLQSEFAAASALGGATLYMNLNAAIGSTAFQGSSGPKGNCTKKDKGCVAYNYGYNAAADAFIYARSQGASSGVWWLDVEIANSWQRSGALNQQTVLGALDYLQNQARVTAGVYSTGYQWNTITGGMQIAIPNWVAGASSVSDAATRCSSPFTGSGSVVWLVQYPNGGFDGDYAC